MDVSVAICTRNRAPALDRILQSLAEAEKPTGLMWELLIVDNGSTDHTSVVAEQHGRHLPVVYVYEPEAGLSNARNAAVRAAQGRYIIWTDDDVLVDREWLSAYVEAFHRWPNAAVFGGAVSPVLHSPTPSWFSEHQELFSNVLAKRDPSPAQPMLREGSLPYGANFAVRRAEQTPHLYDPQLGVGPGRRRLGEETQVIRAILATGVEGYWVPDSVVYHQIPPTRQTVAYLAEYYRAQGETDAFLARRSGRRASPQMLFHHAKIAAKNYILFNLRRHRGPPRKWLANLRLFSHHIAALAYLLTPAPRGSA
jgi:glycosyltransferase involved in cell wall biosynthesis